MKLFRIEFFVLVSLFLLPNIYGQGFVNLNFENAMITAPSVQVLESAAIPGWMASPVLNSGGNLYIFYDTASLGGALVSLEDGTLEGSLNPLQGLYSVLLEGSTASGPTPASIWQTGQIPSGANSLTFFMSPGSSFQVTFNSQVIPLVQIGSTPNYDIMGGNISAFAGQTGRLQFTALPFNGGLLDNVQFSSSSVPEPSVFGLLAMGSLFLFLRGPRR